MSELADRELESGQQACALVQEQIQDVLANLPGWELNCVDGVHRVERVYRFKDFAAALAFTNLVAAMAEKHDHHPALLLEWGRVTTSWWTHSLEGVHLNDLIMAAKTERLYQSPANR